MTTRVNLIALCEDCFSTFPVDKYEEPKTIMPHTCDDCQGYVMVTPKDELVQTMKQLEEEHQEALA